MAADLDVIIDSYEPRHDLMATARSQPIPSDLVECAARGAAFLDERKPGWAAQINTITLDMASGHNCIVGQLCGGYHHVYDLLGKGNPNVVYTHGFNTFNSDDRAACENRGKDETLILYYHLTQAWHKEIAQRRREVHQ